MTPSTEQRATGTLDEIGRRDNEVTSEYRIFGPPGTGKTTNLTRQIRRAVDRYGAENILITSFSRDRSATFSGEISKRRGRCSVAVAANLTTVPGVMRNVAWGATTGSAV